MLQKTIDVSEELDSWIKDQVRDEGFEDESAYIQALIERDRRSRAAEQDLRQMIHTGLKSGRGSATKADIQARVEARLSIASSEY